MATRSRRSSFSSSQSSSASSSLISSSMAKRHLGLENPGKAMAAKPKLVKKRPTLADLMNQTNGSLNAPRAVVVSKKPMVPCEVDIAKMKKESSTLCYNKSIYENLLPTSCNVKSRTNVSCQDTCFQRADQPAVSITASSSMDVSPSKSDGGSVSLDETMSTCDFLRSLEFEYIDNDDALAVNSIERKACSNLDISDPEGRAGNICKRDILVETKTVNRVVGIDDSITDPQFCATFACEIYKNLQASERKKMPRTDFVERIQEDINASMRAILIDWLVEVAEGYSLVPETLFLTVNYIDRYLSGNVIQRQRLQLLGVACLMIAAKYEEICVPQVEEFCYVADNTYFKKEVLQMESSVLNYLKFEMSAPTARFFLTRFVRAAQGINEVPSMQFGYLANYLTELSLLEYGMLCYAPSLIAASAIFLAEFMLNPLKRPWTLTLMHYTLYKPSDLRDCVKAIHRLVCNIHGSSLPAIREKYSQHKKENNNNQGPTQKQAENQPQRNNNEEINAENTNEEIKEENKENKPNPKGVIVLGVYMHCQGCADKIVKYLRGFDGVEQIETDMKNHIVTVKGKKADPKKILERLPKKSNKHVKLISPILREERRKQ